MTYKMADITGKKFGKLTVIKPTPERQYGKVVWLCSCKCGGKIKLTGSELAMRAKRYNPGCGCQRRKECPPGMLGFLSVVANYKKNAKSRGLIFALTDSQCLVLFKANCYYCGSKPSNKRLEFLYNGIDRKNSKKGYISSNVVTCCKTCNYAKGAMSYKSFIAWMERITLYQAERKP